MPDNDDDEEGIPVVGEVNVDQIIERLTRQLFNIQVHQLSVTTTEVGDESNQRDRPAGTRPCHCTVCRVEGLHVHVSGVNNTFINQVHPAVVLHPLGV